MCVNVWLLLLLSALFFSEQIPPLVVQLLQGANPSADGTQRHARSSAKAVEYEDPNGRRIMLLLMLAVKQGPRSGYFEQ